ncbi:MAG TPA: hypothetical protein VM759_01980 [Longimicrobium sp.]|nr:hypothetical protein [Longimicrobium sp.]
MRKLRLDLDAVQVESFVTDAAAGGRGTVDARQRITFGCPPPSQNTCAGTCSCGCGTGALTCDWTCGSTCAASCNGTCGDPTCAATCGDTCAGTCWDPTCESCLATCNFATGPERCCAVG